MTAYYNEVNPEAAAWLRELIKAGVIAPGEVDERDIRDVRASDLKGFTQCHFFAGIGVWSYALRLAGWPDDRPVWTGSCPCQPFSAAGKRTGTADERHLWPDWHWLIRESKPDVVFGEQVASRDGLAWLDIVSNELERSDYACGPVVIPACGVGAPHIRHRLFFVAERLEHSQGDRREQRRAESIRGGVASGCGLGGLADSDGRDTGAERKQSGGEYGFLQENGRSVRMVHSDHGRQTDEESRAMLGEPSGIEWLGHADGARAGRDTGTVSEAQGETPMRSIGDGALTPGPVNGFWSDSEWIYCRDEKFRPVEPGTFPLAHGAPKRVGRLRGYGNAIVAQAAAEIIRTYLEDK